MGSLVNGSDGSQFYRGPGTGTSSYLTHSRLKSRNFIKGDDAIFLLGLEGKTLHSRRWRRLLTIHSQSFLSSSPRSVCAILQYNNDYSSWQDRETDLRPDYLDLSLCSKPVFLTPTSSDVSALLETQPLPHSAVHQSEKSAIVSPSRETNTSTVVMAVFMSLAVVMFVVAMVSAVYTRRVRRPESDRDVIVVENI